MSQDQTFKYLNDQKQRDAAQAILKKKYNNLKNLCEHNCKQFTGPHSVLQIFIEKIVEAVKSFADKLKLLTRDELSLWVEDKPDKDDSEDEKNLNELNYSINGIDLNLIFKMQDKIEIKDGLKKGIMDGLTEQLKEQSAQWRRSLHPTFSLVD